MQRQLLKSAFYGLLLGISLSAIAEPIDQTRYMDDASYHLERRQKTWPDGAQYDGEWLGEQPHGQGMYTYTDGGQYWGRFRQGKRQGDGMMKYANGDEYEGTWFDDQPQGKGTLRYATGVIYAGEFKAGAQDGQGRQTYVDGTYYDGQWHNNVPHGYGRLTFVSGGAYEGQFDAGKPHGTGQYFYANGDLYDGQWKNGQPHGTGRIDYGTGGYYEGQFVNGDKQGKGIWLSALGKRFEGPFVGNQPDGKGRCSSGEKVEACTYRKGQLVSSESVLAAKSPEPVATAAPASAPLAAAMATTALVASSASAPATSIETASAVATKPAVTAKATISTPTAVAPEKPVVAHAPATASSQIKSAIPASTSTTEPSFASNLEQEKQNLKKNSVAELNQTRSDIYFTDNWRNQDLMALPEKAWWNKKSSLFKDELEIVSQHGDVRIRMLVSNYKGPGQYRLDNVIIETPGQHFEKAGNGGTLVILDDQQGWLSGSFNFEVNGQNGEILAFNDGLFRVKDQSQLLSILK